MAEDPPNTEYQPILERMRNLLQEDAIFPWLNTPKPSFGGSTPLQVLKRGETERIWHMIEELESGNSG